jgi:hexosaminidase
MDSPNIAIVPRPDHVTVGTGELVLDSDAVRTLITTDVRELGPEAYRLTVDADGVVIEAGGEAGVFYGRQTLQQLLPPDVYRKARISAEPRRVPFVEITDSPRFRWRGAMLDVARHFLPKADVLRFLDLMAMHKLNVLHFHLTEDQGWRLEIKRYPRLTEIASWRKESPIGNPHRPDTPYDGRPHGGYYTQDDIREIVAYAAERHITVVPEIDVPGHSTAAIAAYPELGNQDVPSAETPREVWTTWGVSETILNVEESTVEFYQNVLDEVCDLFPGEYVSIGGDECPKAEWQASARAQARMAELGLADEEELQAWFLNQLGEHVAKKGRKLLAWDEVLEGGELSPGTVIASWRSMDGAVEAARRGHDTVNCPVGWVYLDYKQSDDPEEPIPVSQLTTLERVYSFEPIPAGLDPELAHHVIGSQATIWTEYMDSPRTVDYMAFPRLCAFAETVWSSGERDFAEFSGRLDTHLLRLDAIGVEYRHAEGPLPWQKRPGVPGR